MKRMAVLFACVLLFFTPVQAHDLNAAEEHVLAVYIAAQTETAPYAVQLAMAAALLNRLTDTRYPDSVSGILSAARYGVVRRGEMYDRALSAVRTAAAGMDITDGATEWARAGTADGERMLVTFRAAGWVFGFRG